VEWGVRGFQLSKGHIVLDWVGLNWPLINALLLYKQMKLYFIVIV